MPDLLTPAVIRRDLAEIIAAAFMGSLALAAFGLYVLRRRSADATSLTFSAFTVLYAIRLAAWTTTVPVVVGGSETAWDYFRAALTYAIVIPAVWFAEALLGAGRYRLLHRLRRAGLIFAPLAIAGMFVARNPEWMMRVNNAFMLTFVVALVLTITGQRTTERVVALPVVRIGLIVAVMFVLAENLRSIGLLPWPVGLEFMGMLVFLSSLGFAVAERFLQTEGRLAAVDRELATARRIQQAILPDRIPAIDRFRIHPRYVPMTEVAGDFYDFVGMAPARGSVLVADVSGHGVPAALIASMVKIATATYAHQASDPGQLLTGLSRTLEGQLGGQFVTAMCVHLDAERGEMAWSGAGHPPLLHWRRSTERIDSLPSDGMLIGLLASMYGSRRVAVEPGDRIILYTDGVLEAANGSGEFFGDRRFEEVIARCARRPGEDLADAILDEMARWRGGTEGFEDDVTLIVIEVTSPPSRPRDIDHEM